MPAKRKTRRRNVQMGFYDSTGFHPIRASRDYDSGLFDEEGSYRRKKKKGKAKGRRKNASTSSGLPADPSWLRQGGYKVVKSGGKAVLVRKKNPLPIGRMVTVKARRRADGKIDIFG